MSPETYSHPYRRTGKGGWMAGGTPPLRCFVMTYNQKIALGLVYVVIYSFVGHDVVTLHDVIKSLSRIRHFRFYYFLWKLENILSGCKIYLNRGRIMWASTNLQRCKLSHQNCKEYFNDYWMFQNHQVIKSSCQNFREKKQNKTKKQKTKKQKTTTTTTTTTTKIPGRVTCTAPDYSN